MTSRDRTPNPPSPPPSGGTTALVFAGGDPLGEAAHRALRAAVGDVDASALVVIAADSGLHEAQVGGWSAGLVVGDLDSVDPDRLAAEERQGARVERHPAAKDATDLALALDAALDAGAARVVVAGGHGGRLDHLLANVSLLASSRYRDLEVSALLGPAWVHVVWRSVRWTGDRGELVTLLALPGPVTGVTTSGLLYPLDGATLEPGSTRGVSNEQLGGEASVSVTSGVLVVVRPGELGTHAAAIDPDAP